MALVLAAFVAPALAEAPGLGLPISCALGETCWVQQYPDHDPSPAAKDYTCGRQTYDGHDGIDIRIRDTAQSADVLAAAAGTVKAVRDGVEDHLMRTAADRQAVSDIECGNGVVIAHGPDWETQYCHMKKGSVAVAEGDTVAAGQRLGVVGYSGMAAFPHVHLTVRNKGQAIDPFRNEAENCGGPANPLWTGEARAALAYHRGDIIRSGFASGSVAAQSLEEGTVADDPPTERWEAIVAFGWAINLQEGDEVAVNLAGPGGMIATNTAVLDHAKAQYLLFAGKKRPKGGWQKGLYAGRFEVRSGGSVRLFKEWQVNLQ